MFFLQIMPEIKNYEDIGLKSFLVFLVLVLLLAIRYLYKSKEQGQKDHKKDLKFFDNERAKINNELIQALNKISLNIEENRLNDNEMRKNLDKVTLLVETIKSRLDEK